MALYLLAVGRVRSKKNKYRKNKTNRPAQNTPRNPQQPGDRGQIETVRDATRPPR